MADEYCLNCGAPLQGPFCHACGQPVKGLIRHFKSIVADFLDTVFEYDGRIWRTLLPLYFVPGKVTLDYVAGRRARFVTPFRLVFVLLVLAFLVLQLVVTPAPPTVQSAGSGSIGSAQTIEEVETARAQALADLDEAAEALSGPGRELARRSLDTARRAVDREADRRLEGLAAAESAREQGLEPPPPPSGPQLYFGDRDGVDPWDPVTNPVAIGWLPDFANRQINTWIGQAAGNLKRIEDEPERFANAFLGILPAALFVLMPVFALLLKLFYVRTGRLYMEHMVIALHSHSFLAMAIIVSAGLGSLAAAVPAVFGLQTAVGGLYSLSLLWIPLHILIMQRRVYAQSWKLTVAKFVVIGMIYTFLVILTVVVAALVTLVRG
jgi:hypothetical protein